MENTCSNVYELNEADCICVRLNHYCLRVKAYTSFRADYLSFISWMASRCYYVESCDQVKDVPHVGEVVFTPIPVQVWLELPSMQSWLPGQTNKVAQGDMVVRLPSEEELSYWSMGVLMPYYVSLLFHQCKSFYSLLFTSMSFTGYLIHDPTLFLLWWILWGN